MATLKGLAFDLEGPVVNVEAIHDLAWNKVAQGIGYQGFSIAPDFIGLGNEAVAEYLSEWSGCGSSADILMNLKDGLYDEILHSQDITPRVGFLEFFGSVRQADLQVAIGSLTLRTQGEYLIEQSGVSKLFSHDLILFREDVKNRKPAPDVFLETARRMGIDPTEQLVFEDSVPGVTAAKAAGSQVIAMPVYMETISALKKAGAARVFEKWEDVKISELLSTLSS